MRIPAILVTEALEQLRARAMSYLAWPSPAHRSPANSADGSPVILTYESFPPQWEEA